jgi:phenylacetate-coenzyme A ligase PaaK-like adenylate-forming protein
VNTLGLLIDTWSALNHAPRAIRRRQRARLRGLAAFARAASPFYREQYRALPEGVAAPTLLPVTAKPQLMACFDDWVTDRAVTLPAVRAFIGNPELIGEPFLGKYLAATTSGTAGAPGVFLLDERYLAVNAAVRLRIFGSWLTAWEIVRILGHGVRTAQVVATNGRFIGVAASARCRRGNQWLATRYRVISVHTPVKELVATLNQFRSVVLTGYASMIALLAGEQVAGRLHLDPVLVVSTAEFSRKPRRPYMRPRTVELH